MVKTFITSVSNINMLTLTQMRSLLKVFNINILPEHTSDPNLVRQTIAACPSVLEISIEEKVDPADLWICFSHDFKFVCFHVHLSFSKHTVLLPSVILSALPDTHLTMVDKLKLLAQISMADQNGIMQLHWSFLCTDQMVSAAKMFGVSLTTTQIQSCPNIANVLGAKVRKSTYFGNQYGTAVQFAFVYFDFSFDNLLDCIGNGTDASSLQQQQFLLPCKLLSTKETSYPQVNCGGAPRREDQATNKAHLIKTMDAPISIKKSDPLLNISSVDEPQRSPCPRRTKIHSVACLASASLEQLQSIITYYGIKCSITRRVKAESLADIVRSCKSFSEQTLTSPIPSDVLFCLNESNEVACIFQDLSPEHHILEIPKTLSAQYKTLWFPSSSFGEELMMVLQKALASHLDGSFSVPWIALTRSQMVAVAEDHCEGLPHSLDANDPNIANHLLDLVTDSASFKEKAGKVYCPSDSIAFIGSAKSPLDLSLQTNPFSKDTLNKISVFFSTSKGIVSIKHNTQHMSGIPNPEPKPHEVTPINQETFTATTFPKVRSGETSSSVNATPNVSIQVDCADFPTAVTTALEDSTHLDFAVTSTSLFAASGNSTPLIMAELTSSPQLHPTISPSSVTEHNPNRKAPVNNYSLEVDDNFNLKAVTNPSPCFGMVDPSTNRCTNCKTDCTSETLHCGICFLGVHYSCYPSEKDKKGFYRPMPSQTFQVLSGINNITWLCNVCESSCLLSHILDIASRKVKAKVSSSIGQLHTEMDELEELIGDDTVLSTPGNPSSAPGMYSASGIDPLIIQTAILDEDPCEKESSDSAVTHSSKVDYQTTAPNICSQPLLNLDPHKDTPVTSIPINGDVIQLRKEDHRENSPYLPESPNSFTVGEYTISWSSKEDQNSFIQNNVCRFCQQECGSETTISCYICSILLHFPCSKITESNAFPSRDVSVIHTSKELIQDQNCIKWFCNSCKDISFQKGASLIGDKVLKKARKNVQSNLKEELATQKNAQANQNSAHFPSFQKQLCSQIDETIKNQLGNMKEEILKTINCCKKTDDLSITNTSDHTKAHSSNTIGNPSYADTTSIRNASLIENSQLGPSTHNKQQPGKVNPSRSVIIKNVLSPKFRNSSNCKSQFNKHFERMRIKAIFPTQAGNIIVELYEEQDVTHVLNEWKPNFFCTSEIPEGVISSDNRATTVVLMENSRRPTEIIVKKVHKHLTEEEICAELNSRHNQFSEATVKRFIKRNGDVLNTVKITFKKHEDYRKAIQLGLFIYEEHFNAEAFLHQQRAHQCFKCKHFGHPAKWCSRKIRCEYCSNEGHAGRDCIIRDEIHEYYCSNCKGQHSSTYYRCPVYIKHLRKSQPSHELTNEY